MTFVVSDGNKVYGHSAKGTPCVAVAKFNEKIQSWCFGCKFFKIVEFY